MSETKKRLIRVPIRCQRCFRPIGYAEGEVIRAVCMECVDRPLEERVALLERRLQDALWVVDELRGMRHE